jgi:hypothetical protein
MPIVGIDTQAQRFTSHGGGCRMFSQQTLWSIDLSARLWYNCDSERAASNTDVIDRNGHRIFLIARSAWIVNRVLHMKRTGLLIVFIRSSYPTNIQRNISSGDYNRISIFVLQMNDEFGRHALNRSAQARAHSRWIHYGKLACNDGDLHRATINVLLTFSRHIVADEKLVHIDSLDPFGEEHLVLPEYVNPLSFANVLQCGILEAKHIRGIVSGVSKAIFGFN